MANKIIIKEMLCNDDGTLTLITEQVCTICGEPNESKDDRCESCIQNRRIIPKGAFGFNDE